MSISTYKINKGKYQEKIQSNKLFFVEEEVLTITIIQKKNDINL